MPENRRTKYLPSEKNVSLFLPVFPQPKLFSYRKLSARSTTTLGNHMNLAKVHWAIGNLKKVCQSSKMHYADYQNSKLFVQRKLCRPKSFAEFFRKFLCVCPAFMSTNKLNRYPSWLGDIDIYRKTFLKLSQNCAQKIKNKTRNHRYRNNRQLSRYRRFARSAAGLKNF